MVIFCISSCMSRININLYYHMQSFVVMMCSKDPFAPEGLSFGVAQIFGVPVEAMDEQSLMI